MYIVQKETLFQEECFLNNSQAMKEKNHFEIFFIISHLVQAPTPTTQTNSDVLIVANNFLSILHFHKSYKTKETFLNGK